MIKAIGSIFQAVETTATAIERVAKTIDITVQVAEAHATKLRNETYDDLGLDLPTEEEE